jgi:hypothetical protein
VQTRPKLVLGTLALPADLTSSALQMLIAERWRWVVMRAPPLLKREALVSSYSLVGSYSPDDYTDA